MHMRVITTYGEFLNLENDWNRLLLSRPSHSVFDTFEWNKIWLKHFQHTCRIEVIVFEQDDGQVSHIFPFIQIGSKYYLMGGLDRDRSMLFARPTQEEIHTVFSVFSQSRFTHAEFRNMPIADAWQLKWLLEDLEIPHTLVPKKEYVIHPSLYDLSSRAVHREMGRKIRKLKHKGNIEFSVIPPERHDEYLQFLFTHNESRAIEKKYRQRFDDPHYQDWFREMIQSHVLGAHPFALMCNATIIAQEFGFLHKGTYASYSTAFDPTWARYSPGMLRIPQLIHYAQDAQVNVCRLGSGIMGYKQQFTDEYNQLAHIILYRSRFIKWLHEAKLLLRNVLNKNFIRVSITNENIRRVAKLALSAPFAAAGLHRVFRELNEKKVRILCYHKVSDHDATPIAVSLHNFIRQMKYIKKHFHIIPLSALKEFLVAGTPLPRRTIVITIDDGYRDNYDFIFPIIKRMQIPVAIFVCGAHVPDLRSKEQGNSNMGYAWDIEKERVMNIQEMREMHKSGLVEFYPHTLTHPILSRISKDDARREIIASKRVLEDIHRSFNSDGSATNQSSRYVPDVFAYPSGKRGYDFNSLHEQIVREAGFAAAFSVNGYADQEGINLYSIPRRAVQNEPLILFRLRISGVLDEIKKYWVKRRR